MSYNRRPLDPLFHSSQLFNLKGTEIHRRECALVVNGQSGCEPFPPPSRARTGEPVHAANI